MSVVRPFGAAVGLRSEQGVSMVHTVAESRTPRFVRIKRASIGGAQMILACLEWGVIRLHPTEDDAIASLHGSDVAAGVVEFYNDDGVYLEPVFEERPPRGVVARWFRKTNWRYHLEPQPEGTGDPMWVVLLEHPEIEGDSTITSLEELRQHLSARGVSVERPEDA